jgi:hypothetical protein
MTLSDEELRSRFESVAATAPVVDLASAARVVVVTPQPRGIAARARLIGVASAAAFAAVALAIVGSIALRDDAPASHSPGESSGAISTASAAASPTSSPGAGLWTDLVWEATDPTPFSFGGTTLMTDGVADGDGFLVIGDTGNDERTSRLWRSRDGRAWTELDGDRFATAYLDRILKFGTGFLMIGFQEVADPTTADDSTRFVIWWSDDGIEWVERTPEVTKDTYFGSVAAGPSGVLLRFWHGSDHGETWFRGDAKLNWTSIEAARPNDTAVFGIAPYGTGWIAYGETGVGNPTTTGAIWTSADAVTWVPAKVDDPGESINLVQSIGNRLVAVGSRRGLQCGDCLRRSWLGLDLATWVSSDGRDWQRASEHDVGNITPQENLAITMGRVAIGEDRILTLEPTPLEPTRDGRLRVWQTMDGFAWSEVGVRDGQAANANGPALALDFPVIVGRHGVVAFSQDAAGRLLPMYAEGVSSARLDLPTFAPWPSPSGP